MAYLFLSIIFITLSSLTVSSFNETPICFFSGLLGVIFFFAFIVNFGSGADIYPELKQLRMEAMTLKKANDKDLYIDRMADYNGELERCEVYMESKFLYWFSDGCGYNKKILEMLEMQ